jgi:aminoglycoside phosphotransferase (APT) family kinase protein
VFERVASRLDPEARLLRSWTLDGGTSTLATALELRSPDGSTRRAVVRQYAGAERRGNRYIATQEFNVLKIMNEAGVPVPVPYFADESREILPGPYLVTEFIDAATVTQPTDAGEFARKLAAVLSRIHGVPRDRGRPLLQDQHDRYSARVRATPASLDGSLSEGRIRAALMQAWPPPIRNEPVILHGDFWPGNTLWRNGELAAVIDWDHAGIGDPLADVANGRLELCMLHGPQAALAYTGHYRSLVPSFDDTCLPCWDLFAALRPAGEMSGWGLDAATLTKFRGRHREFVDHALQALRSGSRHLRG